MFRTVCNKYRRVLIFFIFSSLRVSMGFVQTDPIDSKVQTFFPDMRKCSHCDKHLLNQCHQYAYAFLNDTVFLTPLSVTRGHSITLSNEEQFHPWQMESLDITPPDQVSKTEAMAIPFVTNPLNWAMCTNPHLPNFMPSISHTTSKATDLQGKLYKLCLWK